LKERSAIFVKACENAQLGWLVDFTSSAVADYFPREGKEPEPPESCLIEADRVAELRNHTKHMIQEAAESGRLIHHPRLAYILFSWREFSDDAATVSTWVNSQLANDVAVAMLAKAFTSETWSQGMGMFGLGDRVAIRKTSASVRGLDLVMDVETFRRRLEELDVAGTLTAPYRSYVATLLEAWRKIESGEDRD
jgi:hypothetical protein